MCLLQWIYHNKKNDYVNLHSVIPFYLIFDKADSYTEENNRNKNLTLVSNDKNKEILRKYTEFLDKIKNLIKKINDKSSDYQLLFTFHSNDVTWLKPLNC